MNRRRRTLPPVPPKAPSELRPLIAAMTEILETGEGVRGDPLDRKITLRDLLDSGIGRLKPGTRPGQDGNLDSGTLPPAPDLSIPPAPAGFDAQGGFYGMINLSWTIPGQQYSNHAYTNIFRSEEDNFANADVIGREAGGFYTDYVRDDVPDPDDPTKLKGYYYWITFTSVDDVEGPPNSTNGTYAAPLADLGYVIELLTGEIDAGVLAQSLREEIEKIPAIETNIERLDPIEAELRGPESLDGSVANRIAAEREDRIEALDDERAERIDALTFEAQARAQAIQSETDNRTTAITQATEQLALEDSLLALQQNVIAASYNTSAASIYSMSQIRINDNEVFATQIDQLFGSVGDNNALILNEEQIRVNQFSALSTQVGILSARLDSRPSLNSSFEPGSDYDGWTATSGNSIAPEVSDVYAGQQAALIASSDGSADPNSGGVRRIIGGDTATEFAGNEIRVAVYAKQPDSGAALEFALAYQVAGESVQWQRFTPTNEWAFYDAVISVPEGTGGVEHAISVWGDTSGAGDGVLVDRMLVTFAEIDIPEVTAAIEEVQQALVDQEQAVASELAAFLSQLDDNTASIQNESEARSTQYDALASDLQALTAQTQDNAADIAAEREAWTSAVDAVATDVLDLSAQVNDNEARITLESEVRATEDALSASIQRVMSAANEASSATFYSLEEVRATDALATALRIDGVEVQLGDAVSSLESEQNLLASENEALATQITTAVADLDGDISTVQQTISTEVTRLDGRADSQAQALTAVQSDINGQLSTVEQNFNTEVTRIDGDLSSNAQAITDVQSATDDALAGVQQDFNTEIARVDDAIDANANAITEVRSDLGSDIATVQQSLNTNVSRIDGNVANNAQAITTAESQLDGQISTVQQNLSSEIRRVDGRIDTQAQAVTTVQSQLGDDIASVQQSLTTNVQRVDGELVALGAKYTAQVQANGLIGGFGVYNDGSRVDAGFDVDRFWIGRTDSDKRKPFIIDNNVVYMNNVMIRNGSIQEGQLGAITIGKFFLNDGTPVTTAGGLIRAEAIDVDNLSVAEAARFYADVQSGNYIAGQSGWRIRQNGNVEFNQGTFNGQVEFKNVTGAGSLASKDSLSISEILNAGSLASKNNVNYDSDVTNKPTIDIRRLSANSYNGEQLPDAYSNDHKVGQLIFELSGASGWPEAYGGVVTYWYAASRATQVCYGNDNNLEFVRYTRPNIYPQWTVWKQKEVFSSADVKILETSGAGQLAAKDSVAINEVLNAGLLASKDKVNYDRDVDNRPIVTLGTNAYNASDRADAYSNEHKAGQLMFTSSSDWPTVGGVVTYWTNSNRASQVCYSTGSGLEWVRRTNPSIYPAWTDWVRKEIFSSSDVDALQTINGPAQAGADQTGSNTAYNTARVAGSSASNVRQWALNGNSANNRTNDWMRPDSTRIDGNKIYTGDAYVDTLQIKGDAVTVPEASFTEAGISLGTNWTTVQTLWVSRANAPVHLTFGCSCRADDSSSAVADASVSARLVIGDQEAAVYDTIVSDSVRAADTGSGAVYARARGLFSGGYLLGAGTGAAKVEIQLARTGSSGGAFNRFIQALTVKR